MKTLKTKRRSTRC